MRRISKPEAERLLTIERQRKLKLENDQLENELVPLEQEKAACQAEYDAAKKAASSTVNVTLNDIKKKGAEIATTEQTISRLQSLIAEQEQTLNVSDEDLKQVQAERQAALADVALGTKPKSALSSINTMYKTLLESFDKKSTQAIDAQDTIAGLNAKLADEQQRLADLQTDQNIAAGHYLKSKMADTEQRFAEAIKAAMTIHDEYAALSVALGEVPGFKSDDGYPGRQRIEHLSNDNEIAPEDGAAHNISVLREAEAELLAELSNISEGSDYGA